MAQTVIMSRKGQITIPKAMRNNLSSSIMEISVTNQGILLHSIEDVGGCLGGQVAKVSYEEARKSAWAKVAHENK